MEGLDNDGWQNASQGEQYARGDNRKCMGYFFGGEDDAKAERQKILEALVQPGRVTVLQSGTWHSD